MARTKKKVTAASMIGRTGKYSMDEIHRKLAGAERDVDVGIRHTLLEGEGGWGLHAAEFEEGKFARPHLHEKELELYRILEGTGVMHLWTPIIEDGRVTGVRDGEHRRVTAGETITVGEGQVHSLENTSRDKKLIITFSCPDAHLGEDRVLVDIDPRTGEPLE